MKKLTVPQKNSFQIRKNQFRVKEKPVSPTRARSKFLSAPQIPFTTVTETVTDPTNIHLENEKAIWGFAQIGNFIYKHPILLDGEVLGPYVFERDSGR